MNFNIISLTPSSMNLESYKITGEKSGLKIQGEKFLYDVGIVAFHCCLASGKDCKLSFNGLKCEIQWK